MKLFKLTKQTFLISLQLIIVSGLLGQGATKVASSAGQFLKIGVGSSAAAMGGAYTSVANDASSIYWNPAGLAKIEYNQVMFTHIDWLVDISYDYIALGVKLNSSASVGLFAATLQVPKDEVRTVQEPEGTGEFFEAGDLAVGVSYARNISDKFSVGFVGKFIQETIWSMTSTALAVDVGTLYRSSWNNLKIGIVLNNFGTPLKLSGRANLLYVDPDASIEGNIETIRAELEMNNWDLPMNLTTSLSVTPINNGHLALTTAIDMVHPNDNNEYFNAGGEIAFKNMLFLRSGYQGFGQENREGGLAFGGGLNIKINNMTNLKVDYALSDYGRLKDVHQFSLVIGF